MANQFKSAYAINIDSYTDNLDASIEMAVERPDRYNAELEFLFHPLAAESRSFKMTSVGSVLDLPKISDDESAIPVSTPAHGLDQTFDMVEYRQKVAITRSFMESDRLGKGTLMAGGLPNGVGRKKEYLRAGVLSAAFSGTAGADGAALCADAHTSENPRGATWDNLISGVLNVDNWHAMRLLADTQVNELGYPDPVVIETLLIPPALRRTATEIQTAKLNPENAFNQPNVLVDLEIKVGHFLSSSTAYFGIGNATGPAKGLFYVYQAEGPDLQNCKPSDNPDIIWAMRSRFVCDFGFTTSRNIYGSPGT